MYRSVIDSGWVAVTNLTVMVGKNEAGKSALLQALYKLNPSDKAAEYEIASEWPRDSLRGSDSDQIVCTGRFRLTADEVDGLKAFIKKGSKPPRDVEISRDYDGWPSADLDDDAFPDLPDATEVAEHWASVTVPDTLTENVRNAVESSLTTLRDTPADDWLTSSLEDLASHEAALKSKAGATTAADVAAVAAFAALVGRTLVKLRALETPYSRARDFLCNLMPAFIYMADYPPFVGTARLDEVKSRIELSTQTESDRTFLMILALAGMDLDALIADADGNVLGRQFELDEGATALTNRVKGHWSQGNVDVGFRADANEFMTFVRVPERSEPNLIQLEERSRGFQWFFSFDLMFMHESGGTFRNCVLLLDEPGLHLHPGGQTDLVRRLEQYAATNTVIYTTHLPFMLNLREPQRIRVVSESARGTVVNEDLSRGQKEAALLLDAAFGISLRDSYLVARRNLVVEGASDFFIVTELSNLIARSKRKAKPLPDDVLITPSRGASQAAYLATFMAGQRLGVVLLLDSDDEGMRAAEQLVKSWLTRYDGTKIELVDVATSVGAPGTPLALEDLFAPEDFYLSRVLATHEKEIRAAGHDLPKLSGAGSIVTQVQGAFTDIGIGASFNKGRTARALRADLLAMSSLDDLPIAIQDNALKLVAQLNKSFAKLKVAD